MQSFCKTLIVIAMACFMIACGTPEVGTIADMSGYEGLNDKDTQVFLVSDTKDFLQRIDEKQTFVAYFGYTDCPWCNDAISVLNEAALNAGMNIYYINTRPNKNVKANCEIPDYDLLVERVGENFSKNEENIPYLYVPFVFFINKGNVEMAHEGTINGYDSSVIEMPDDFREQLLGIYQQGFNLLQ